MSRRFQMVKGKHHIQFPAFLSGQKLAHFHPRSRRLPHGKGVVRRKSLFPYLPQIPVKLRPVIIMLDSRKSHQTADGFIAVGEAVLLGYIVDDVHAEPVHPFIQPAVYHGDDVLPQLRVLPV